MRRIRVSSVSSVSSAAVLVAMMAALLLGANSVYLQPGDIDATAVLSGPPADDSPEHQAEIATLLHWQERRAAQDVARCKSEENVTVFVFAEVLGDWFNEKSLPYTNELMNQSYVDAKNISNSAKKKKWNRIRPPVANPEIHACVALENSPSYPSGHATRGVMWAALLSEMFPEHKDELMARGKLIGEDRVIAGMHYPSDVEAGQKLGAEIARRLLENPQFKAQLDRAKEECMAGVGH